MSSGPSHGPQLFAELNPRTATAGHVAHSHPRDRCDMKRVVSGIGFSNSTVVLKLDRTAWSGMRPFEPGWPIGSLRSTNLRSWGDARWLDGRGRLFVGLK